jgi:hypothetical protein
MPRKAAKTNSITRAQDLWAGGGAVAPAGRVASTTARRMGVAPQSAPSPICDSSSAYVRFTQCACVCGAQVQKEQYQRWPKRFSELHKEKEGEGLPSWEGGRQPKREALVSGAASGGL